MIKKIISVLQDSKRGCLKEFPAIQLKPITSRTKSNLNARIQRAIEEKTLIPQLTKIYKEVIQTRFLELTAIINTSCFSWKEGETHH